MLIGIFLIQLLQGTDTHGLRFWITAAGYVFLIAAGIIGKWNLFKKTGRTPWHSLIPIWNEADLYDKIGRASCRERV